MNNKILTEGVCVYTRLSNIDALPNSIVPNMGDTQKLVHKIKDYIQLVNAGTENSPGNYHATPWGLAKSLKSADKILRYLFTFIMIGGNYGNMFASEILKEIKRQEVYTSDELSTIRDFVLSKITAEVDAAAKLESLKVAEAIEKHDKLNPKLWNEDKTLKPEVADKINEIVNVFIDNLVENKIELVPEDIIIIGSNVAYNYTKDSDLDIHIIVDTTKLDISEEIASALYSAYRSLFNKDLDIYFYDIPVELYVETNSSTRSSNGVYSVKNSSWIKEPDPDATPSPDALPDFMPEYEKWEKACKKLLAKKDKLTDEKQVNQLIEDIYFVRKSEFEGGKDGEQTIGNLVFKELRNNGYLDELKDLKNELLAKRLSLESLTEGFFPKSLEHLVNEFEGVELEWKGGKKYFVKVQNIKNRLVIWRKICELNPVDAQLLKTGISVTFDDQSVTESLSQEIGDTYKKLSKLYGYDIGELIYGADGFMDNCYPNGFPDFAGDVIYSEKYWNEFENWLKENRGITLKQPGEDEDPWII